MADEDGRNEHLDQSAYDAVIVGTGLVESIVAAATARVGKSVVHLDPNDFYGGEWASFTLLQLNEYIRSNEAGGPAGGGAAAAVAAAEAAAAELGAGFREIPACADLARPRFEAVEVWRATEPPEPMPEPEAEAEAEPEAEPEADAEPEPEAESEAGAEPEPEPGPEPGPEPELEPEPEPTEGRETADRRRCRRRSCSVLWQSAR